MTLKGDGQTDARLREEEGVGIGEADEAGELCLRLGLIAVRPVAKSVSWSMGATTTSLAVSENKLRLDGDTTTCWSDILEKTKKKTI